MDRLTDFLLHLWVVQRPKAGKITEAPQQQQRPRAETAGEAEEVLRAWLEEQRRRRGGPDLLTCLARARDVCRLPYLIGAAPVVYGLPVRARPAPPRREEATEPGGTPPVSAAQP